MSNNALFLLAQSNNAILPGALSNDFMILVTNSNQNILFGNSNTSNITMKINSNGFIGIGTSNPQAQLHVTSNIRIDGILQFNGIEVAQGTTLLNSNGIIVPGTALLGYSNTPTGTVISIPGSTSNDVIRFVSGSASNTIATLYGNAIFEVGTSNNPGYVSATNLGFFRNRIINGDMSVAQRATTSNFTNVNGYCIDRFWAGIYAGVGTITASQITLTSSDAPFLQGFKYSYRCTATNVTNYADTATTMTIIENLNLLDLNWGTSSGLPITISFWFKATISGSYSVALRNAAAGGTWYGYAQLFTYTTGGTWQYITMTIPAPPSNYTWNMSSGTSAQGIQLIIGTNSSLYQSTSGQWVASPTEMATGATIWMTTNNNYIELTGVQLEKGTIATPFEFRPYQTELELCQRYYEVVAPTGTFANFAMGYYGSAGGANILTFQFKTTKRANPTASGSLSSPNGGTLTPYINTEMATYKLDITAAQSFYLLVPIPLAFSAEL